MRHVMMPAIAIAAIAAMLSACEGATGPMGPPGPPGPPGPVGPPGLTYAQQHGTIDATGRAEMTLPATAFARGLPMIACYVSPDGSTWLVVDHTPTTAQTYCILHQQRRSIELLNGPPGWRYHLIAQWRD